MAKPKRLSKKILQEDREAYAALKAIVGYDPSNEDFTLAKITESLAEMDADQTSEVQKHAAADASSDKAAESEHKYHNNILGAKNQIKAQFGESSDELAAMGMKKKNEYLTGRRTPKPNDSGTP